MPGRNGRVGRAAGGWGEKAGAVGETRVLTYGVWNRLLGQLLYIGGKQLGKLIHVEKCGLAVV